MTDHNSESGRKSDKSTANTSTIDLNLKEAERHWRASFKRLQKHFDSDPKQQKTAPSNQG